MDDRKTNPDDFIITDGVLVEYIGSDKVVMIPYGVTSIGDGAFYGCESLTSVVIPSDVESIGDDAFNGCRSLTNIAIPSGVKSIGKCAFGDCPSLTIYCEEPYIPRGWESDFNCDNRPEVWGHKGD